MSAPLRIALSGSAGTGKTTLGRALAERLGLPYIEEGMRRRLERGLDLHRLCQSEWIALITDLWAEQRALEESARSGFVADRSSLDYAAFRLHYGLFEDASETADWFRQVSEHAHTYDRIFVLPWGVLPLHADGVRSPNPWVQLRFQAIVEGVLARFAPQERVVHVPPDPDFATRLAFALAQVGLLGRAGVEREQAQR